ncbi:MAG: hypothetical protein H0U00_15390 [Actinobacteria bacterium]|nr:hypothetical protein [Actinomycetota bacterium]
MSFTVRGVTDDGREAAIAWYEPGLARRDAPDNRRGLVGDEELIERALLAEIDGRTVRATRTGPFYRVDLDDPIASLLVLSDQFRPGYRVDGSPPVLSFPVPEGAIA